MGEKKEIVYAFIDSQNLHLGTLNSGWKIDYRKFRNYLTTKYKVSQAYLFIGHVPSNAKLYEYLRRVGFVLIFKPVTKIRKGTTTTYKGNVDAELVLHTMIQYPNYEKAIIVSGDGDFYCLAEYLDTNNKLYKILTPNEKYSSLLRRFAKLIVPLHLISDKLRTRDVN